MASIKRPPKKKPKKRPETVPENARWDEEGFWVDGPTDDEGRAHGLTTSWWSDGALCARVERHHGEVHGEVTRYHLNGEVAQTFAMVHGKFHGVRTWYYTDEPTYEIGRPAGLSDEVMRSENVCDMGDILEIRHFDGKGQRVTHRGEPMDPKPEGLPEDAWKDPRDGLWKTGRAAPDGTMIGKWTYWDAEGQLLSIGHHAEDESLERFETFHADGSPALDVGFVEGRGTFRRGPVPEGYQDFFIAEGADEVRFVPHALDPVRGRLWPLEPRYFTADGEEVPAPTDPEQGPPAEAEVVSRGSYQPTLRWRHAVTEGDTTTTYWREDGSVALRTTHEDGDLITLEERDEQGGRVIETFQPGTNDGYQRPLHAETVVATEGERWVFTYDDAGRITAVTEDDEPLEESTFQGVDTEGFAEAFERRFEAVQTVRAVSLWFDFCSVVHLELETIERPFGATTLTGDGGGNSAMVVTEGRHAGRVFFQDHEEGPFALDEGEVRDFLEDSCGDVDAMSVDERVEAMPFFDNSLADSLREFFEGIQVGSDATYWGKASDFEPFDPEG